MQVPDEALYPSMPLNAIARTPVEKILSIEELGHVLADRGEARSRRTDGRNEVRSMPGGSDVGKAVEPPTNDGAEEAERLDEIGESTGLTCPGCGGAIWEIRRDGVTVLRCHVGHAYGPESFDMEQTIAVEGALWTAVRAIEEKQMLLTRLGDQARSEGRDRTAASFLDRAEGLEHQAESLRQLAESVMASESASTVASDRGVPA